MRVGAVRVRLGLLQNAPSAYPFIKLKTNKYIPKTLTFNIYT